MIGGLIEGALKAMKPEQVQQLKTAVNKTKEFLPIVDSYHKTIELKDKEHKIAYLAVIEGEAVVLYQVALKSDEEKQKVYINRTLEKYDVIATVNELTAGL